MELRARREMDPLTQWDLTHIYASKEEWQAAFDDLEEDIPSIAKHAGRMGDSAGAKAALDEFYAMVERLTLINIYAMLAKSGDNGDAEYQAMEQSAAALAVRFSAEASFITPELAALPIKTLEGYLEDAALSLYRHQIEDIIRVRRHVLPAEQERLLSLMAEPASTPDEAFTMLESVDMTFPDITGEDGSPIALTHGSYSVLRESPVRSVRKEAFETYLGEFRRYINTISALYAGSVKYDNFTAAARSHESALDAALYSDAVDRSVYEGLIEAVHSALPAMRSYLELRSRKTGLDELHMYDLYNPIVADVDESYTFEQAKALVKEALAPLGAEYAALLQRAYDERWIDVYENRGKTTGAFCCGVYGVHPYVLLNFTGKLDDVFTLAHELGHAMHSYLSDEAQAFANHDYSIMAAEVASTVNEVLLLKHLIARETDDKKLAYLYNHYLEGFRTTLLRQTLFAEFEMEAHAMAQRYEPLTADTLNALYRSLNEQYYEGAVVDELQDVEWARIPHFYNAFYVYQYATGYSSAVALASRIFKGEGVEEYLGFLRLGGSMYPIDELRTAGIDLTTPDVVRGALEEFARAVDMLSGLLG